VDLIILPRGKSQSYKPPSLRLKSRNTLRSEIGNDFASLTISTLLRAFPFQLALAPCQEYFRGTFKLCRSSPYVHQSEENGYRMNRIRVRNSQSRLPARCLEDGLSLVPSIQSAHGIALIAMSWTGEPCCLSSSPSFSSNRGPSQTNFPLPFPPILCQL